MEQQARLFLLASMARSYLEPFWLQWHRARSLEIPAVTSANTCGRSSLFLRDVLRHEGFEAIWENGVPGAPHEPTGFFDGSSWHGHAWVVSSHFIVDITADQFGDDPVIVTPADDMRYRATGIDTAFPQAIRARSEAVAALWPGWLTARTRLYAGTPLATG